MDTRITEGYVPGCIGRIAQLHAHYYATSHQFGVAFEALVARELGAFCLDYRSGRDGLWLAQTGGAIEGSVALDGAHATDAGAHLRWFIVSDALRGQGTGRQLLQRALDCADACGYRQVYLWTFAGLHAARHLYESCGFRLVHEAAGSRWGARVTEQRFERQRPAP